MRLRFSAGDSRGIAGVYRAGRVLNHEVVEGDVLLEVEMPARLLPRYQEFLA